MMTEMLKAHIEGLVKEAAKDLREALVKKAVDEFEVELRAKVGLVAMGISSFYSVQSTGQDLVVHIKIGKA